MWRSIGQISSGFYLLAFLAAVGFVAYRAKINNKIRLLRSLPAKDRATHIDREFNTFGINSKDLTRSDQFKVLIEELNTKKEYF
jgi:hypothetical protein